MAEVLNKVADAVSEPMTDKAEKAQAAAERQATAGGGGSGDDKSLSDKILGLIGTGAGALIGLLGVAGVVTVFGSVFLWERFDQAGIAPEQALEQVPGDQVIVYGAEGLILAALFAAAAVVLVWAFDRAGSVSRITVASVGLLVIGGIVFASLQGLPWWQVLVAAAFALVLWFACLVVAERSGSKFVPFATAVVVAVGMWNFLLFFLITEENVPVTPAAVVEQDGTDPPPTFKGYYVAEGDDNIYLAIPTYKDNDTVLRTIPKSDDTEIGIGHPVDRDKAKEKMEDLAQEIIDNPAPKLDEPDTTTTTTTTTTD